MNPVRLDFVDFWPGFDRRKDVLLDVLRTGLVDRHRDPGVFLDWLERVYEPAAGRESAAPAAVTG
ncbi:hypothetical protein ACOQFB_02135 [Anaeromyxobacter sp. Red801]|uniref:hypothetical protein n=1 Tax=Anaeromyxobacter sp. Red801 TaxID=3411632 RepID=UPI003B9EB437